MNSFFVPAVNQRGRGKKLSGVFGASGSFDRSFVGFVSLRFDMFRFDIVPVRYCFVLFNSARLAVGLEFGSRLGSIRFVSTFFLQC